MGHTDACRVGSSHTFCAALCFVFLLNLTGLDSNSTTMSWIIIGLNWTVLLESLEMTFVVIWRYINKTELNLLTRMTPHHNS